MRRSDSAMTRQVTLSDRCAEIDSRLAVGLNYDEYGDRVGDARVAYDALPIGDIERACLKKVAIKLESALSEYLDVLDVWGTCLEDYYCDFSEGEPNKKAQLAWLKAEGLIDRATSGLESMAPSDG